MSNKKSRGPSGIVVIYLVSYNIACCTGWLLVLALSLKHALDGTLTTELWKDVEFPLKLVQTAAVLEIIHSIIGLVKSPWFTTTMQVFSRVWTLWAVIEIAPPAQSSIFFVLAAVSWGLVEVPRYLFYALNLLHAVPYPIFWLRYSLFAILYPTGITGELGCMYYAAKYLQENPSLYAVKFSAVPSVSLSLFLAIVLVALTYIPGSPTMYSHMAKTRKKQFAELKGSSKKKV